MIIWSPWEAQKALIMVGQESSLLTASGRLRAYQSLCQAYRLFYVVYLCHAPVQPLGLRSSCAPGHEDWWMEQSEPTGRRPPLCRRAKKSPAGHARRSWSIAPSHREPILFVLFIGISEATIESTLRSVACQCGKLARLPIRGTTLRLHVERTARRITIPWPTSQ